MSLLLVGQSNVWLWPSVLGCSPAVYNHPENESWKLDFLVEDGEDICKEALSKGIAVCRIRTARNDHSWHQQAWDMFPDAAEALILGEASSTGGKPLTKGYKDQCRSCPCRKDLKSGASAEAPSIPWQKAKLPQEDILSFFSPEAQRPCHKASAALIQGRFSKKVSLIIRAILLYMSGICRNYR